MSKIVWVEHFRAKFYDYLFHNTTTAFQYHSIVNLLAENKRQNGLFHRIVLLGEV